MNYNTKKEVLTKIWEKLIKDNKDTIPSWSNHPKSFVKWGMSKIKNENQTLELKNKKFKLWLPYNLKFTDNLVKKTNKEVSKNNLEEKPKRKRRTKEEMLKAKEESNEQSL